MPRRYVRTQQTAVAASLADINWRLAACAGTDTSMWFPDEVRMASVNGEGYMRRALNGCREVCGGCPIRSGCLDWAVRHNEPGIWAGTTPQQRRRLRALLNQRASRERKKRAEGKANAA